MELSKLLRAVRIQAIKECQAMVRKNPDDDRYVLAARMSDLKLVRPDTPEIVKLKQDFLKWNLKEKKSNTPQEDSPT